MASRTKAACGRPPKFDEPRRPITVTLPVRTLEQLEAIDPDRAQAIVKLAGREAKRRNTRPPAVDVVEVAPGCGIILVGPMRSLEQIRVLRLVEVAPDRYLLTIPSGTAVESVEIALLDMMEGLSPEQASEKAALEQLRGILGRQRRNETISKREMLLIDTRAAAGAASRLRAR